MDAKELRIGNLIGLKNAGTDQIRPVSPTMLYEGGIEEYYKSVRLTQEWLLDFGFDKIFSRQLEALATPKDLIMAFSASGDSKNVINGVTLEKTRGISTIGLTGKNGGELAKIVDIAIKIPSDDTARIQEIHTLIGHVICGIVEETLFGEEGLEW